MGLRTNKDSLARVVLDKKSLELHIVALLDIHECYLKTRHLFVNVLGPSPRGRIHHISFHRKSYSLYFTDELSTKF